MKTADWHIVAYDIKSPKRLAKVHRQLQKIALPLQKSVFLILANEQRLFKILNQLTLLINSKEDDIRTYPVHSAQSLWLEGQSSHSSLYLDQLPLKKTWNHTQKCRIKEYPDRIAPKEAQ